MLCIKTSLETNLRFICVRCGNSLHAEELVLFSYSALGLEQGVALVI
jgi:hypothetical protein